MANTHAFPFENKKYLKSLTGSHQVMSCLPVLAILIKKTAETNMHLHACIYTRIQRQS